MSEKKPIKMPTTGVFDFETLVTDEEAKYVDKTGLLYELARHKSDAQLFISRPRRFGKSLMLSTLKAMFEGRRDLFKGLAIDKLPWEGWETPTPVYSFTMGDVSGESYAEVKEQLGELVGLSGRGHEVQRPNLVAPCAVGEESFAVRDAYLVDAEFVRDLAQALAGLVGVVPPLLLA